MLQIADFVAPALSLPEALMTIMVVVGIIGFPFALFFAWAYELTPDGVKPTNEVMLKTVSVPQQARK